MRGMHTREHEGGGDRLAVRTVAEGHRFEVLGSESFDQLADLLGLTVWGSVGGTV